MAKWSCKAALVRSGVCNTEQVRARVEEKGILLDEASAPVSVASYLLSNNRGSRASRLGQAGPSTP